MHDSDCGVEEIHYSNMTACMTATALSMTVDDIFHFDSAINAKMANNTVVHILHLASAASMRLTRSSMIGDDILPYQ
jgi:hypothetical protein